MLRGVHLGRIDRVEIKGSGVRGKIVKANDQEVLVEVSAGRDAVPGYREVRVSGPDGISNPKLVRIDTLSQTAESEPNDSLDQANVIPRGAAGVGVLDDRDADHFRIEARRGEQLAIDLEARRLGAPITPVVTVLTAEGHPLIQRRETPGLEGDCRFSFTFPTDGAYVIQVRDNLYGGSAGSSYRLRVTTEPYATGLFPLGGQAGRECVVTASGGTLRAPIQRTVRLPDNLGAIVEIPPFESLDGPILAPGKLVAGGELQNEPDFRPAPLTPGRTLNGRLSRPGEVDRYPLPVAPGEAISLEVVAEGLGSWLDAVLTVRDSRGTMIAENDDAAGLEPGSPSSRSSSKTTDSRLTFRPETAEGLTVEVSDRYGRGGPEYSYRLSAGPTNPDFRVSVTLEDDEQASRGVVILRPGAESQLRVQVNRIGGTGPITLQVEGLPPRASCPAIVVRKFFTPNGSDVSSASAILSIQSAGAIGPASGRVRVVATASREDGRVLTRQGGFPLVPGAGNPAGMARPVSRTLTSVPFWVYIGGNRVGDTNGGPATFWESPTVRGERFESREIGRCSQAGLPKKRMCDARTSNKRGLPSVLFIGLIESSGLEGRPRRCRGGDPRRPRPERSHVMLWRHPCLVRAWSAAGLLTCSLLATSATARAEPAEPAPTGDDATTQTVSVLDAKKAGDLKVEARGAGDDRVKITLTNASAKRLKVVLPPGLVASSATAQPRGGGAFQSMGLGSASNRSGAFGAFRGNGSSESGFHSVAVSKADLDDAVAVPAGKSVVLTVTSVCLNFGVRTPNVRDNFEIVDVNDYTADPRARKALRSLATYGTSHGVAQSVMWRVCNDVPFPLMAAQAAKVMNTREIALASRFVEALDASGSSDLVDLSYLNEGRLFVRVVGEGALGKEAERLSGALEGLRVLGLPMRVLEERDSAPATPSVLMKVVLTSTQAGETKARVLVSQTDLEGRWTPLGKTGFTEGSTASVLDGAGLARALDRSVGSAFVTVKTARRATGMTTMKIDNRLPFTLATVTLKTGPSAGAPTVSFRGLGVAPSRSALIPVEAPSATLDHVEFNGL